MNRERFSPERIRKPRLTLGLFAMGGDDAGGGGPDGNSEGNDDAGGKKPDAPAERPAFVPEKFWDPDNGTVRLEDTFKSYTEIEKKFGAKNETLKAQALAEAETARLANRPEKPDAYEVALPADYAEMGIAIEADDPMVSFWRAQAHEMGLSNEGFNNGIKAYVDASIKARPDANDEMAKLGDTARQRTDAVGRWAGRQFKDEHLAAVQGIATTAAGVEALEMLMSMAGESGDNPGRGGAPMGQETTSQDDLTAMMDDPRYWDANKRDNAFVAKVDAGFAKLYGVKKV